MDRYDVQCPACGRMNLHLDLLETEGFMECEACGAVSQHVSLIKMTPHIQEKANIKKRPKSEVA